MKLNPISIEDLLEVIDNSALSSIPFNLNPRFLHLSADHLKQNSHLLTHSDFGPSNINPFFIWIKNSHQETLGFLPVLQVENVNTSLHLIPAKSLDTAILYRQKDLSSKGVSLLEQELLRGLGKIHCQSANVGWDLSDSLFSIFKWFPQQERKEMIKKNLNIQLKEVTYREGRDLLKKFYETDLEKKKNFPGIIRRDIDLFQYFFPENYRVILVELEQELIGVTSFIDYSDKIYQMEFVGNSTFNKFYPKILFQFFQILKNENKKALYPAFFEWCLIPFIIEMVKNGKADMTPFMKKAAQTKARNAKEIDL